MYSGDPKSDQWKHTKTQPFETQSTLDHLKSGHVQNLGPHCSIALLISVQFPLSYLNKIVGDEVLIFESDL